MGVRLLLAPGSPGDASRPVTWELMNSNWGRLQNHCLAPEQARRVRCGRVIFHARYVAQLSDQRAAHVPAQLRHLPLRHRLRRRCRAKGAERLRSRFDELHRLRRHQPYGGARPVGASAAALCARRVGVRRQPALLRDGCGTAAVSAAAEVVCASRGLAPDRRPELGRQHRGIPARPR